MNKNISVEAFVFVIFATFVTIISAYASLDSLAYQRIFLKLALDLGVRFGKKLESMIFF
jgi:hypothetical protein